MFAYDDGNLLAKSIFMFDISANWRLGLERADSAREAVKLITGLVDEHGLFCGDGTDPAKAAEIGFLVCDRMEAWAVEVSGRQWVSEHITSMQYNLV